MALAAGSGRAASDARTWRSRREGPVLMVTEWEPNLSTRASDDVAPPSPAHPDAVAARLFMAQELDGRGFPYQYLALRYVGMPDGWHPRVGVGGGGVSL